MASFQEQSADFLKNEYLAKIELAIAPLTTAQIWWRPNDASNSIGNLMLHLAGNVRQWIVGGVAGGDMGRDRSLEFATRDEIAADDLLRRLRSSVRDACTVIDDVSDARLDEPRKIQGFQTTVLGAIYHVVEHFSMHTGQIIMLAKMQTGRETGFYRTSEDGTVEPVFTARRAFAAE